MKLDENGNIILTPEEANEIMDFIDTTLWREWDRYTGRYICSDDEETRTRRMNKEMHYFRERMLDMIREGS